LPSRLNLLQIEQRDALVDFGPQLLGISRERLLKILQRLFEGLLVHVTDAQVVQPVRLRGGVAGRSRRLTLNCEQANSN